MYERYTGDARVALISYLEGKIPNQPKLFKSIVHQQERPQVSYWDKSFWLWQCCLNWTVNAYVWGVLKYGNLCTELSYSYIQLLLNIMLQDYRRGNSVTLPDCYPFPRISDCIDNIGSAKNVTKLDLLKGYWYWQVPLTPTAFDITDFVTSDYFLQYTVMTFGMINAPAMFKQLVNVGLADVLNCRWFGNLISWLVISC